MNVYLAVPTYGVGVDPHVYHNHLVAAINGAVNCKLVSVGVTKDQLIHAARNMLVEGVLEDKDVNPDEDYIWWLDSDVIVPPHCLKILLSHGKDVVTGVYYQKSPPFWPLIMLKLPFDTSQVEKNKGMHNFLYDYPKGLYKVDAIGFGCVITKVNIFTKKIEKPWFDWTKESGEDIYFCIKAKEKGVDIWADTTLTLGHVGHRQVVLEDHFVKFRDSSMTEIDKSTYLVEEKYGNIRQDASGVSILPKKKRRWF